MPAHAGSAGTDSGASMAAAVIVGAGADDAGHTESGGCSNKLVTARPEAWAITGMKSVDVIIE